MHNYYQDKGAAKKGSQKSVSEIPVKAKKGDKKKKKGRNALDEMAKFGSANE